MFDANTFYINGDIAVNIELTGNFMSGINTGSNTNFSTYFHISTWKGQLTIQSMRPIGLNSMYLVEAYK